MLPCAIEGNGLVVEADDAAAARLLVAADEADAIADGQLVAAQALARLLADPDVGTVEIDRGIRDQPALPGGGVEHQGLLAPQLFSCARIRE
ncbi:MAG: hypothetical protein L6Q70_10930 [Thauera sp.]|nr:hypothetical protein [Thauera sp.]